jgi:hypothetical protein
MNVPYATYEEQEPSYRAQTMEHKEKVPRHVRRSQNGAHRGKAPAQFNGIHRRRRRRMAW